MPGLPKNDGRKALIAHVLMERASVRQKWIVETLEMGSAPYVSRLAAEISARIEGGDRRLKKSKNEIVKMIT